MVILKTRSFKLTYMVRATTVGGKQASIPIDLKICGGPAATGGEEVLQPLNWQTNVTYFVNTENKIMLPTLVSSNSNCPVSEVYLEAQDGVRISNYPFSIIKQFDPQQIDFDNSNLKLISFSVVAKTIGLSTFKFPLRLNLTCGSEKIIEPDPNDITPLELNYTVNDGIKLVSLVSFM